MSLRRHRSHRRRHRVGDLIVEKPSSENGGREYQYRTIKLLGKGGFAEVFSVRDEASGELLALKIVLKAGLKRSSKEKLKSEIKIHSRLRHPNICRFVRCFEDKYRVYLLMELCECQTLMEVLQMRKRLTEMESRFILSQLITGLTYMHGLRIIHRDLKLGNLFLDHNMELKIGDFGLAAQLDYDGQRKRTLCGTPNYIAPEILRNARNGHSYEVDIWSLGVIMFTLMTGKPPFETLTIRDTYRHIKASLYTFPAHIRISDDAKTLIRRILVQDPVKRPVVFELLQYPFFKRCRRDYSSVPRMLREYCYRVTKKYPGDVVRERALENRRSRRRRHVPSVGAPAATAAAVAASGAGEVAALAVALPRPPEKKRQQPAKVTRARRAGSAEVSIGRRTNALLADLDARVDAAIVRRDRARRDRGPGSTEREAKRETAAVEAGPPSEAAAAAAVAVATPGAVGVAVAVKTSANDRRPLKRVLERRNIPAPRRHRARGRHRAPPVADVVSETENAPSFREDDFVQKAHDQLEESLLQAKQFRHRPAQPITNFQLEPQRPASPRIWVKDCADYSKKYGLAYRFNNGIVGAYYNDLTMMLYNSRTGGIKYYLRERSRSSYSEHMYTTTEFPDRIRKKIVLIKCFSQHFDREDGVMLPERNDDTSVFVKMFLRNRASYVFRLSNRIVQVRFNDSSEIILSSEAKLVTYRSKFGVRQTFPLESIINDPPEPSIAKRLKFTKNILDALINERELVL